MLVEPGHRSLSVGTVLVERLLCLALVLLSRLPGVAALLAQRVCLFALLPFLFFSLVRCGRLLGGSVVGPFWFV
jgi:hypothetical protein